MRIHNVAAAAAKVVTALAHCAMRAKNGQTTTTGDVKQRVSFFPNLNMLIDINQCCIQLPNWHRAKKTQPLESTVVAVAVVVVVRQERRSTHDID